MLGTKTSILCFCAEGHFPGDFRHRHENQGILDSDETTGWQEDSDLESSTLFGNHLSTSGF